MPGNPHFPPVCNGCGEPLLLESLYMDDGCPCNTPRGVNFTPQPCEQCRTDNCVKPGHRLIALYGPYGATSAPNTASSKGVRLSLSSETEGIPVDALGELSGTGKADCALQSGALFAQSDPGVNAGVRAALAMATPEDVTALIAPIAGYHVRKCRGHFHVCCDDMDLRLTGDPFPTMEAAVIAMEEAELPPGKPAVNPSGSSRLPHREGEPSEAAVSAAINAVWGRVTQNVPLHHRDYTMIRSQYRMALKAAYAVDCAAPSGSPSVVPLPSSGKEEETP